MKQLAHYIIGARKAPIFVIGDNITTDHLSPSNAILANSAAGEYLHKMGLPEEDFNSYATHRGDHLTAQRATFANPKLFNEMVQEDRAIGLPKELDSQELKQLSLKVSSEFTAPT